MKIQTQAWLLVAGIVLAPLLITLSNLASRYFTSQEDSSGLPEYEDVFTLMDENISVQDWESLSRFVTFSQNIGEATLFRDDYFVLHSTIPEFLTDSFADKESILTLIDTKDKSSDYTFTSRNLNENRVYILTKRTPQLSEPRAPPLFIPFLVFVIVLIIFAISMSIGITRTITRSVQILENATRRIAEGELDLNVDVKGSNEITSLTNSLNKMRNTLKEEELRRSRFIMGITHDLKTPLALIKGYAEAIEDGITDSAAAEIIAAKADQLEGMINDLINFVQMETGEWREQLVEVNAAAFFEKSAKAMSIDIELLHHDFVIDINLPANLPLHMDERLAQRALENLITNAVRYTPNGTVIRFTAALVHDAVELTISDNGPGIDEKDLPHVFEMFYRGSSSRREQGMGLGLAVVKWVADYHGWSISVLSKIGEGTCFKISIPHKKNFA